MSRTSLLCLILTLQLASSIGWSQTTSLQDIAEASWKQLPPITIYVAKEVITLNEDRPQADAIAVVGDRILSVGSLVELEAEVGDQEYQVNRTFHDKVIVPGFIAQHDHPVMIAIAMASEVLSIEDWALPGNMIPAVIDKADFLQRLARAERALGTPDTPLVSWGYHPSFFGKLTRGELDKISNSRPIVVIGRSMHEAISQLGGDGSWWAYQGSLRFMDQVSARAVEFRGREILGASVHLRCS